MAEKDKEGLESALELLRERTTKDGAKALEQSLKLSSPRQQLAHLIGFMSAVLSSALTPGIPELAMLSTEILARTSWDGMRRAIAELEDERQDDAKRAELLALFDEDELETEMLGLFRDVFEEGLKVRPGENSREANRSDLDE